MAFLLVIVNLILDLLCTLCIKLLGIFLYTPELEVRIQLLANESSLRSGYFGCVVASEVHAVNILIPTPPSVWECTAGRLIFSFSFSCTLQDILFADLCRKVNSCQLSMGDTTLLTTTLTL